MECYTIQHSRLSETWQKYKKSHKNNYVAMQYEYGIQHNSTVSERWNRFIEIKEGDILFLQNQNRIYAWGYAIKPRLKNKKEETVSPIILKARSIVKNRDHSKYRSDNSGEYITFSDCEVFYENLEDDAEKWGQRIDVDKWNNWNEKGTHYISKMAGRAITKKVSKIQAQEYIKKLSGNNNFKI